jgi:hypothetical protein
MNAVALSYIYVCGLIVEIKGTKFSFEIFKEQFALATKTVQI